MLARAILKTICGILSFFAALYGIVYGIMALQRLNSGLLTGVVVGIVALVMFIYSVACTYAKMKKKAGIK